MIRWPGQPSRVIQRQGFAAVEDGKVVVGVAGEADDIADGQDGAAAGQAASGGGFLASAARIRSASASHRRVEPSTSVNRNVTTPEVAAAGADTSAESHNRHALTSHFAGIRR
jgi:hypothetical protein